MFLAFVVDNIGVSGDLFVSFSFGRGMLGSCFISEGGG